MTWVLVWYAGLYTIKLAAKEKVRDIRLVLERRFYMIYQAW